METLKTLENSDLELRKTLLIHLSSRRIFDSRKTTKRLEKEYESGAVTDILIH